MKISYRWLREYVDTDLPPAQLADRLTNAGVPVEGLAPVVEGLSGVVVGEIEAIEREVEGPRPGHANRLCRVALPDRKLSILCGAPNAAPGLRTAVAPPGASLPGGRTITAATIRGTLSEGMLCSEKTPPASSRCPPTRRWARISPPISVWTTRSSRSRSRPTGPTCSPSWGWRARSPR